MVNPILKILLVKKWFYVCTKYVKFGPWEKNQNIPYRKLLQGWQKVCKFGSVITVIAISSLFSSLSVCLATTLLNFEKSQGPVAPLNHLVLPALHCILKYLLSSQRAEAILNKISDKIDKTHTELFSALRGFQKCIA